MKSIQVLAFLLLTGCTALGPMPATTAISAVPAGRPGIEAQVAAVPGFMLSDAAHEARGQTLPQLAALVEPDRWFHLPGLILGAHLYGPDGDTYLEPYVGYRTRVSSRVSLAGVGYGTAGHGTDKLATYRATRFGGELAADVELARPARWFSLHAQAAASAMYLSARGTYCVDPDGVGIDCDTEPGATNTMIDARVRDAFFGSTLTLAADFGRLPSSTFHVLRLAVLGAGGTMPHIRSGAQHGVDPYWSVGFAVTVGFGDARH